jgi:hypothetical protein
MEPAFGGEEDAVIGFGGGILFAIGGTSETEVGGELSDVSQFLKPGDELVELPDGLAVFGIYEGAFRQFLARFAQFASASGDEISGSLRPRFYDESEYVCVWVRIHVRAPFRTPPNRLLGFSWGGR